MTDSKKGLNSAQVQALQHRSITLGNGSTGTEREPVSSPATIRERVALFLAESPEGVTVLSMLNHSGATSSRNIPSLLERELGIKLDAGQDANATNEGRHNRWRIQTRADCLKVLADVNRQRRKRNAAPLSPERMTRIAGRDLDLSTITAATTAATASA
jgi:hypothetical protein